MPKAAPNHWPYLEHRNMALVMKHEARSKMGHDAMREKRLLPKDDTC
jgi:hypothetical protein